jgi:xylulokinase
MFNIKSFEESGIEIKEIRATGGGSRSPEWVQLKADMTGKEVKVVAMTEASALGAAICAGAAAGRFDSIAEGAGRMVSLGKTYIPDIGKHEHYLELSNRHFALYDAVLKCRTKTK